MSKNTVSQSEIDACTKLIVAAENYFRFKHFRAPEEIQSQVDGLLAKKAILPEFAELDEDIKVDGIELGEPYWKGIDTMIKVIKGEAKVSDFMHHDDKDGYGDGYLLECAERAAEWLDLPAHSAAMNMVSMGKLGRYEDDNLFDDDFLFS
jgi:hypothetical protein